MQKNWKTFLPFIPALLFMIALAHGAIGDAPAGQRLAEEKPKEKLTIKKVMKEAHKKPKELLKKVAMGKATEKEKKRLLHLYAAMSKMKPPTGEEKSWKGKCGLLVTAAKAAVDNKKDAGKQLTKASNCKGCHNLHKPTK